MANKTVLMLLLCSYPIFAVYLPQYQSASIEPGLSLTTFWAFKKTESTAREQFYISDYPLSYAYGVDGTHNRGETVISVGISDKVELNWTTSTFYQDMRYFSYLFFFVNYVNMGVKATLLKTGTEERIFHNFQLSPFAGGGISGGYAGLSLATRFPIRKNVRGELAFYPSFSYNLYTHYSEYKESSDTYGSQHISIWQKELDLSIGMKATFGTVIKGSVHWAVAASIPIDAPQAEEPEGSTWTFKAFPFTSTIGVSAHFGNRKSRASARKRRKSKRGISITN